VPSHVYTFERDASGSAVGTPLTDAINAITFAAADEPKIRYEVITDADNAAPMIVVVTPSTSASNAFRSKLLESVSKWGLSIRHVFHTGGEGPQED